MDTSTSGPGIKEMGTTHNTVSDDQYQAIYLSTGGASNILTRKESIASYLL